ncbi:protein of unknown function [Cupriavidus neocaledonicus]|uniref:Uncharacterized protein n=1 Tax=Cupriavidus neocaledonicus TaxID=1040979 RepID=A0A375H8I8_9BURK|nr:protein of unknown function [Cupriavidus neocaledonicus]
MDRVVQRASGEDADVRAALRPRSVGRPPGNHPDAARHVAKGWRDRNRMRAFAASCLYVPLAQYRRCS